MTEMRFKEAVKFWVSRLRLYSILFSRDNRISAIGKIIYVKNRMCFLPMLQYNFKIIKSLQDSEIYSFIFHELGHIKLNHFIRDIDKVTKEYEAEKFALKNLKKYYPSYYELEIVEWRKTLNDEDWRKTNPLYTQAFDKINEYI